MGSLRAETGEEEALIPMCGTEASPFQGWYSLLGEQTLGARGILEHWSLLCGKTTCP